MGVHHICRLQYVALALIVIAAVAVLRCLYFRCCSRYCTALLYVQQIGSSFTDGDELTCSTALTSSAHSAYT